MDKTYSRVKHFRCCLHTYDSMNNKLSPLKCYYPFHFSLYLTQNRGREKRERTRIVKKVTFGD